MISRKNLIRLVLAGVAAVIVFAVTITYFPKPYPEMSRQKLIDEVKGGYVHEVFVTDDWEVLTGISSRSGPFRVPMRRGDHSLTDELAGMGVIVKVEQEPLGLI